MVTNIAETPIGSQFPPHRPKFDETAMTAPAT